MRKSIARIVCAFMAVVLVVLQPFSVLAAQPSGSLSTSLNQKRGTALKASIAKAREESLNKVAINLGRLSSTNIDMSHYINKKVIRKEELEAFKWSFIFSQFAVPLQDSLDDVFDKPVFKQMEEQDMAISSVADVLNTTSNMQITDATGMMLQSTTFKELKKTMKENLYYLTLYTEAGNPVTLDDLLSDSYDAGQVLYIYDKTDTTAYTAEDINDLYYNQGKLGTGNSYTLSTDFKQIPIFIYNNATFLYLQTAVGSYCRAKGIDIGTLKAQKGSGTLYSDSYGNICVYDGSAYRIVIPNFGNPIFINEPVSGKSDYDLEERIFAYNKWLSTVYSKRTREMNEAQSSSLNPYFLGDTGAKRIEADGTEVSAGINGAASYFAEFLNVSTTAAKKTDQYDKDPQVMKGNLIFIDPPAISASSTLATWHLLSKDIRTRITQIAGSADPYLKALGPWKATPGTNWWGNQGIVMSPANGNVVGFDYQNGEPPIADKFPIMQGNRELNTAEDDKYWNITKAFSTILNKGSWKNTKGVVSFSGNTSMTNSSGAITSLADASKTLETINKTYAAVMGWDYNKLINNPNYLAKATARDGNWASMMFIRDGILDYGQSMDVYMAGTEKGMLLPYYRMFYTGNTADLINGIRVAVNQLKSLIPSTGSVELTYVNIGNNNNTRNSLVGLVFDINAMLTTPNGETIGKNRVLDSSSTAEERYKALFEELEKANKGLFTWETLDYVDWASFKSAWDKACDAVGLESAQMLSMVMTLQDSKWSSNILGDQHFFMSQWYLLPRDNKYSEQLGCNTSEDFVLSTYFWDRYYLTKTVFNQEFQTELYDNIRPISDKYKSTPFEPWTFDSATGKVLDSLGAEIQMANASVSEVHKANMTNYYKSLNSKDIVIHSRTQLPDHKLRVYYTPQDELFYNATGAGFNGQILGVNYGTLLLALQKNTDYEHNYQVLPIIKEGVKESVTLQELMDTANVYMLNPVKMITTILSGLLYDLHRLVGTGSLGAGFDLEWLLDNPVYLYFSDKFVVLAVMLICVTTLFRLFQFMFKRGQSLIDLIKTIISIMLVATVPILMLNSFIYAFGYSSKAILKDSAYKTLLSQIQMKQAERINADGNVDTELALFREQFSSIKGDYDGITLEMPDTYNFTTQGLSYKDVAIVTMMENLKLTWDKPVWFDSSGFTAVHANKYSESLFYYFYDYIKSAYLNYYSTNSSVSNSAMKTITDKYNFGTTQLAIMTDVQKKDLQLIEQNFAMTSGNFREMFIDTKYVYGPSIAKANKTLYDGPQLRDLFGFHQIFVDDSVAYVEPWSSNIHMSDYFLYMTTRSPLLYNGKGANSLQTNSQRIWSNTDVIMNFDRGRVNLYTSRLDPHNPLINNNLGIGGNQSSIRPKYTPFEDSLIKLNETIYKDVLQIIDYLPEQITDESLITMTAMIAMFHTSDTFGMKPTMPIMGSMSMEMLLRTSLIKNVENMDSRVNLLYAMLNDGYGFFGILVAVLMEIAVFIVTMIRYLLIAVIMVLATFYGTFALVFFSRSEKDLRNTLLIGIVINYVGVFFLHAVSAFVVNGLVQLMSMSFVNIAFALLFAILVIVAMMCLGTAHTAMLVLIFRNLRTLGGTVIRARIEKGMHNVKGNINKLRGNISKLASKSGKSKVESPNSEIEVASGEVNVASEASNVTAGDVTVAATHANVLGKLAEQENIESTTGFQYEDKDAPTTEKAVTNAAKISNHGKRSNNNHNKNNHRHKGRRNNRKKRKR